MKKLLLLLFVIPTLLYGDPLRGADALSRLDLMPRLRRGVSIHQQSSFDRSGGNNDRNCWLYKDSQDDYVIFDDEGAGCVYRFWMTHGGAHTDYKTYYTTNHIKIYLDDDLVPRFECSIEDFFSGALDPFITPLVGDKTVSSGGMYSYVPIPYEERCRIALTDIPPVSMRDMPWGPSTYWMYYNVTYHKYSSDDGVTSWDGSEDLSDVHALLASDYAGQGWAAGNQVFGSEDLLEAGSSVEVFSYIGSGVLNRISFDVETLNDQMINDLWLKIFWDGGGSAFVEAPLGDFFGVGRSASIDVDALMVGRDTSGYFYCNFPMPFWSEARMVLENRGTVSAGVVTNLVQLGSHSHNQQTTGYFHAKYATQSYTNHVVEPDFIFLDEVGRGHIVGASLYGTGAGKIYGNGLVYLEGDERIYIDGSQTPQLHGTGNEDYFNGGWYYNVGTFALPYHGSPVRSSPYGMGVDTNYVGAYRLHIGDVIPFHQSIRFGMEHGGLNEAGCHLSSVTYFYKLAGTNSGLIECAQLDVGNPASEAMFTYSTDPGLGVVSNTFSYYGDEHDVLFQDVGREPTNGSSFSLSIPASNDGLIIRRRTDSGMGHQTAQVFVDNQRVGEWSFHDESFSGNNTRWLDDEYYVPCGYTAGKTNLNLAFEVSTNVNAWAEYHYTVYGIKPYIEDGDVDSDRMSDLWEVEHFGSVLDGLPDQDLDLDGFDNVGEYICLTDPKDIASLFSLNVISHGGTDLFSFSAVSSRVYRVMGSTNLVTDNWNETESISGYSGEAVVSTSNSANSVMYYKVEVTVE